MSVKAYRDFARSTRGVLEPELVAPVTAHAAFDKACAYFGVKLVHLPVDGTTFRVSPAAVAAAISANTIAVVVSAPCYAQGVVDPVEAVAALASARDIPVHVDCCLGSFLIPFANEARDKQLPLFDFRVPVSAPPPLPSLRWTAKQPVVPLPRRPELTRSPISNSTPPDERASVARATQQAAHAACFCSPARSPRRHLSARLRACQRHCTPPPCLCDDTSQGVTSISTDPHKYGFAPKGASVIMYAREELRHAQYFVAPEWTGGIYASPSIAGSRPGALIAACWATMVHFGADGYRAAARKILGSAAALAAGIRERVPALRLLGEPDLSVVCFAVAPGAGLSIYNVGDEMKSRGWNLNTLQNPAAIHLCVTFANAERASTSFVDDLAASVAAVRAAPPGTYKNGSGAIYGMAESIEDKSLVSQVAWGFCDTLYHAGRPD